MTRQARILAFGDSLTWGRIANRPERHGDDVRWPRVLEQALGGYATVIEEGLNGRRIALDDPLRPYRSGISLLPLFIVSQTLPLVAIAPLVVLWFGFGLLPKLLLVALVTFFPLLVALLQGYEATDRDIAELLSSMKASRWRIFCLARLPSAMPFFFAGLRIAITYAVVGAIFAEYAGAARGLGIYILNAKNNFRPDLVLAAVVVSALLTLCLFALTLAVQRLVMPWQSPAEKRR